MNRRKFLQILGIGAVAVVAAPVLVEEPKPTEPIQFSILKQRQHPENYVPWKNYQWVEFSYVYNPYIPMKITKVG